MFFIVQSWTGSASLGGYLIESHGFRFSFYITAVVYFVANLGLVPLFWVVPRRRPAPLDFPLSKA
jgi:hypothetical protein